MIKIQTLPSILLLVLIVHCSPVLAVRSIDSTPTAAGFRFEDRFTAGRPIVVFQQQVLMLAGIDDRLTMRVYGDGRVQVHYPVYMKRAGDYEMQLDTDELDALLGTMAANGIMDFDHGKARERILDKQRSTLSKAKAGKAELFEISDAVDSIIDIRLDEYRRNSSAEVKKNFVTRFQWRNIEHDARRFDDRAITRANRSVQDLRGLMKDARLKRRQDDVRGGAGR